MEKIGKVFAHNIPVRTAPENAVSEAPLDIQSLPKVSLNPKILRENRIVVTSDSPASMSYKMLRTRVLQRMRRNGWSTLAVTGTRPGEGKSLTAINLSLCMARDINTSVMLVDLDLRKPSIHEYMGISPRRGLGDYLCNTSTLEQVALNPKIDRLGLLLNQVSFADSSEWLSSPEMAALVRRLRQGDGRIVIFDLPPVLATDDMLAFSPLVDALLLVVSQGTTRRDDLVGVKEMLQDVNVVGTVLNRSSEETSPYYSYGYT